MWIIYALGSALFAGITSILAKAGIKETSSNVATAIRTVVVLLFAWLMVFVVGSADTIASISSKTLIFLVLSGLATGASWLCFYKALQDGPTSLVVPIDRLSIIVTVAVAYFAFKERLTRKALIGLVLIVVMTGTSYTTSVDTSLTYC
jgi:transporter family protein